MENDVILKLKRHLNSGLREEKDMVYLLVEIRKILDHEKIKKDFPYLSLFCDWILHIKIDRNNTGVKVIKQIDSRILDRAKYDLLGGDIFYKNRQIPVIRRLINLWDFKKELRFFFKKFNLNIKNLIGCNWTRFICLLLNVLVDVPLTFDDQEKLKKIKQITIRHNGRGFCTNLTNDQMNSGEFFPNWEIEFKNGSYIYGEFGYIFRGDKVILLGGQTFVLKSK
jgi:hypothetical protein